MPKHQVLCSKCKKWLADRDDLCWLCYLKTGVKKIQLDKSERRYNYGIRSRRSADE